MDAGKTTPHMRIPRNAVVRIVNFPLNNLNGCIGSVCFFDTITRRYAVKVMMKKGGADYTSGFELVPLRLKAANLLQIAEVVPDLCKSACNNASASEHGSFSPQQMSLIGLDVATKLRSQTAAAAAPA